MNTKIPSTDAHLWHGPRSQRHGLYQQKLVTNRWQRGKHFEQDQARFKHPHLA